MTTVGELDQHSKSIQPFDNGVQEMKSNQLSQIEKLYDRSIWLLQMTAGKFPEDRDRAIAKQYNMLRQDSKKTINDPEFDRIIPSARYIEFYPHFIISFFAIILTIFIVDITGILLKKDIFLINTMIITFLFVATFVAAITFDSWKASTIGEIRDWTVLLRNYIDDYISSRGGKRIRAEFVEYLQTRESELFEELNELQEECRVLREKLTLVETPVTYDIPIQVFERLDHLDRVRLTEALQAYRIGAWTPAAAVCGMILESRLQKLCTENNVRPGGIGEMIRRLGESGLLKGYYHNLAKVGEFFRHRASHPTSEQFDREKTTLIFANLVILIRDVG